MNKQIILNHLLIALFASFITQNQLSNASSFLITFPTPINNRSSGRSIVETTTESTNNRKYNHNHLGKLEESESRSIACQEFVNHIERSISDLTFQEFLLSAKKPKVKGRNKSRIEVATKNDNENDNGNEQALVKSISGRLVQLKNNQTKCHVNTKYFGATDIAKNIKLDELETFLVQALMQIERGQLSTLEGTFGLKLKGDTGIVQFERHKSDKKNGILSIQQHDREKNVPLDSSALFLQKLGISDVRGKPRHNMKSKLRQCQRFCEIVGAIILDSPKDSSDQSKENVKVVDMGCGRGYLTFSLHSYLREQGVPVNTYGVEMRSKLVDETNGIVNELGCPFAGSLEFVEGTIESYMTDVQSTADEDAVDVLIALHACDTATDDALWFAVQQNTQVIVAAPCCHKEVRRQLDPFVSKINKEHPMYDVLRYGIYRERISESVTDSLRALLLELANYDVQVFEFIGGEHTAKNVMITATKRKRKRSQKALDDIRSRIGKLATLHGIKRQKLAEWMNEPLSEENETSPTHVLSTKKMPPL